MVKYNYSKLTEDWYIDRSITNRCALSDEIGIRWWGDGGGGGKTQRRFYCQILAHHGKNKGHILLYICRKLGNHYTKYNIHVKRLHIM